MKGIMNNSQEQLWQMWSVSAGALKYLVVKTVFATPLWPGGYESRENSPDSIRRDLMEHNPENGMLCLLLQNEISFTLVIQPELITKVNDNVILRLLFLFPN